MKKTFIAFFLVIAISLTGCGNTKTLKCTYEEDGVKTEDIFTYDGDKLVKLSSNMIYSSDNEEMTDEELNSMKSMLDLICSTYSGVDAIDCSTEATKKRVSVSLKLDISKADNETLEKFKIEEKLITELSYDKIKTTLTDEGYTCK